MKRLRTCLVFTLAMNFIIPLSALAVEYKSVVCPEKNFEYKGITCCLDAVTPSLCRELVDHQLSAQTMERVRALQEAFDANEFAYGRVPNCHWNARYSDLGKETPLRTVDEYEMDAYLNKYFELVKDKTYEPGNLIALVFDGEVRDEVLIDFVPRRRWTPTQALNHSAIYIGNGLLFQKENIGTKIFSISTIEQSVESYQKGATVNPAVRGKIIVEVWRSRTTP